MKTYHLPGAFIARNNGNAAVSATHVPKNLAGLCYPFTAYLKLVEML